MTPTPTPPPIPAGTDDPALLVRGVEALALGLVAGAVILITVSLLLLRAARQPFPTSVVSALTILATLALIGYTVGGEARAELAALAGTAVGALAGATTSLIGRHAAPDTPDTPNDPPG